MAGQHDYLTEAFDQRHETPMQQKFRRIHPMPLGVVFIEWPGMTDDDIRRHFRTMHDLGYTCLKGIHLCRGTDKRKVMHMALDEGLIPWWYGEGGWEPITDELLDRLGIPRETPIAEIRDDPRMRAHQEQVMRDRIDRLDPGRRRRRSGGSRPPFFSFDLELTEEAVEPFVAWLQATYGTVDAVAEAWNFHHAMIPAPAEPWEGWDDVARYLRDWIESMGTKQWGLVPASREYRRLRDILRFKADAYLDHMRDRAETAREDDPHAPFRAGGEMGLFLPFAARATDMEGIADLMAEYGSFYPSIHLAWHFEEVRYEVPRPVFMMAQLVTGWFKGGWAGPWESTGGPQQFSGGKAPFYPPAEPLTPGSTVDGGVMTQLMLSYLAGGFRGFGLWCWTARTCGWEAGEFALTDRCGEPCERTRRVGQVGQAARRWRDELWEARKEPLVGVFQDFDNEAIWAAMASPGRQHYRHKPVSARIGASRALINANVPWEYVTADDLRAGLAARYPVIYLPGTIAIASDLMPIFTEYVKGGGRLVVDMPGAYYDEFGRVLHTGPGTPFEALFGVTIRDYQYARNVPRKLGDRTLEGFVVDLDPTAAETVAAYDTGAPCITENRLGDGAAVLLGYEAALMCRDPEDTEAEALLVANALGGYPSPYACEGAICYRLAAPAADHYFLINDGPATEARLDTKTFAYTGWQDAITGDTLPVGAPVAIDAHSGRWLRMTT